MYSEVLSFSNMSYLISISTTYIEVHVSCERMCIDSQQVTNFFHETFSDCIEIMKNLNSIIAVVVEN